MQLLFPEEEKEAFIYWINEWVSCYIWYSEEGTGRAAAPPRPLLAVPLRF